MPLTRQPLKSKDVWREVAEGAAAAIVATQDEDAEVTRLKHIEEANEIYCNTLLTLGYDGNQLRKKAPRRSRFVAVTAPQSKARVKAIKEAKTAGQLFYATGG